MKSGNKDRQLNIAMIGQKIVPSRRGGVELVLTTLCPLLVDRDCRVTCFNRSEKIIEEEYIGAVVENYYKGVRQKKVLTIHKKGLSAVSSSFFAAIAAALGRYDIVHFHAEGPAAMLLIPKLLGKKCIVTVHGLDWQREKWQGGFGSRYIKFGEKMLAKYADEVIVLSRGVSQYFKDTYGRDTTLIPNGVIKPKKRKPDLIYKKYNLKGGDYFCSLSRLTEEKGVHYLIEAYSRIKTDKKLLIAGDTSDTDVYVSRLKQMAANNPNIIFAGFVSGNLLDEIYSNAYAYILPSNIEGMPLSLLEAMSYGNAVIGSDISEITDVVEDKALIFQKSNVDDLAEKLQLLSDRPELVQMYRNDAAEFICGKYNWDDIADRTVELYKR